MRIVQVHTVMMVAVDLDTGEVVGPVWDEGTEQLYDGENVYDVQLGEWVNGYDEKALGPALDAAAEAFSALLATQGA